MRIPTVIPLSLALLAAVLAGCSREQARQVEKVTIAVTPWPGSAPLYVAHEKGYLRDEGLDPTFLPNTSGHLGLADVLSGKADFAVAGETPICRAAMAGKPVSVLATVSEIDRAILIVARKDRGISAPAELKGKRVGVVAGSTAEFFLHIYLTTSHIDRRDVRVVNLKPEDVVGALVGGDVDAVSTWAPHTILLRDKLGENAVVLDEPGLYVMTWNLLTTQTLAQSRAEAVRRLLRALIQASRYIEEHPAEARGVVSRSVGAEGALFDREWDNYRFAARLDQSLLVNMEAQAQWMMRGAGGKQPNFLRFIEADGLKAVRPEAVGIVGE